MNPEILTLSIISLTSGVVVGYTIGIIKHLAGTKNIRKNLL